MSNKNDSIILAQVDNSLTQLRQHPFTRALVNFNVANGGSKPINIPTVNKRTVIGRIVFHLAFILGLLSSAYFVFNKTQNFRNQYSRSQIFHIFCYVLYFTLIIIKSLLKINIINQYANVIFTSIPTLSVASLLAFTQSPRQWSLTYLPALFGTYQATQFFTSTLMNSSNSSPLLHTINSTLNILKPIISNSGSITETMVQLNAITNFYPSRKINELITVCSRLLISFILSGVLSHLSSIKTTIKNYAFPTRNKPTLTAPNKKQLNSSRHGN